MRHRAPKILIVKLSAIGDVVHTLPALNALRRYFPNAHITWLVEEAAADLVAGHRCLDRVLVSQRKRWEAALRKGHLLEGIRPAIAFLRKLRDTRYDMILDFQAALKGAILISLARGRRKIGFGPGMEHQEHSYWFLNEKIPAVDMEIHALERGLMLLEAIGVPAGAIAYHLPIDTADRQKVDNLLEIHHQPHSAVPIAINPVAQWETKLWLPERFAELADRLIDRHDARVFFTGSRADRSMISIIMDSMHHEAINLAGETSLVELAALYRRMALLITTDTGPMHICAAVETPVVALFGPTAEWRTGPYGDLHQIVAPAVDCRPCFKRTCSHCTCMRQISVEDVMNKVQALM